MYSLHMTSSNRLVFVSCNIIMFRKMVARLQSTFLLSCFVVAASSYFRLLPNVFSFRLFFTISPSIFRILSWSLHFKFKNHTNDSLHWLHGTAECQCIMIMIFNDHSNYFIHSLHQNCTQVVRIWAILLTSSATGYCSLNTIQFMSIYKNLIE